MKGKEPSVWRLLLALAVTFALATPTLAQTQKTAETIEGLLPPQVGVFTLQNIDLDDFVRMLRLMNINAETGHTLANKHYIRFNKTEHVEQARKVLKRLDTPFKNIGLRISLVHAKDKDKDKGPTTKPVADPAITEQLKQLFNFDTYNVLSTSYLVAKSGQKAAMGLEGLPIYINNLGTRAPRFEVETVPSFIDEGGGVIRLQKLEIERVNPSNSSERTALLETTLNIKNGESVIVGGSMLEGETYVVIITADIIQ